jgi:hypothetical protein
MDIRRTPSGFRRIHTFIAGMASALTGLRAASNVAAIIRTRETLLHTFSRRRPPSAPRLCSAVDKNVSLSRKRKQRPRQEQIPIFGRVFRRFFPGGNQKVKRSVRRDPATKAAGLLREHNRQGEKPHENA